MKQTRFFLAVGLLCALGSALVVAADQAKVAPALNGIEFPADYRDWRVIAVSDRLDNNTLRVILGNDIAINAARAGKTNPWPEGAILGKVVWKQTKDQHWPTAVVPTDFVHAEFMIKDSQKWASTGGWGYARWKGKELKPYGKDENFAQECVACHTPVKPRDWVFTTPAPMPNMPQ